MSASELNEALAALGSSATRPAPSVPPKRRRERVEVLADGYRISGFVTLPPEGYRTRVSDLLNSPERRFLSLTDVVVRPLTGGAGVRHPFMCLARDHITWAVPASGGGQPGY